MAKKKKKGHKFRNAAPRAPRAKSSANGESGDETATHRLGYTAAGAAATALVGAVLGRQGWAPKTIAGTLTALGAGLAWKGEGTTTKSLGAGTMAAAGGQLAMMMIDDHDTKQGTQVATSSGGKKPANADELPPGALESAFERARDRLALVAGDIG